MPPRQTLLLLRTPPSAMVDRTKSMPQADVVAVGTSEQNVVKPTFASSANDVRQYLQALPGSKESKPSRHVEEDTGNLVLLSSVDEVMQWLPGLTYDRAIHWARMPIFRVRLWHGADSFSRGDVSYVDQTFPEGEDLAYSLAWWRKRVGQASKGFAVFEGGFDTSGPVLLTDAPVLRVDAASGAAEADDAEEIDRKRALHRKRQSMGEKWALKGLTENARLKIEAAERLGREKRQKGHDYMLRGGWVKPAAIGTDIKRHNEIQKAHGSAPIRLQAAAVAR